MKTLDEIRNLIVGLETDAAKAHPYFTANIEREKITEVVTLVRKMQDEIDRLNDVITYGKEGPTDV